MIVSCTHTCSLWIYDALLHSKCHVSSQVSVVKKMEMFPSMNALCCVG